MIETQHDFIIQRGIDEAFACQDMLARAPATPTLLERLRNRLQVVTRTLMRRGQQLQPSKPHPTSLELTR